jgi:hypothetical protein
MIQSLNKKSDILNENLSFDNILGVLIKGRRVKSISFYLHRKEGEIIQRRRDV